jgi:hypothetical protein
MTKKTVAWILGSALVVCSAAAGVVACSNSPTDEGNTGGDSPAPNNGGKQDATTERDTGSTQQGDSGGGAADAGADCGRLPRVPNSTEGVGVRCPFQAKLADGGFPPDCDIGQHCCIYPMIGTSSVCRAIGTPCDQPDAAVADLECQENADCPGDAGNICCVQIPQLNVDDRGCTGKTVAKGPTKTACRPSTGCSAGESQICTADGGECATGKTCTAFEAKTNYMGACL